MQLASLVYVSVSKAASCMFPPKCQIVDAISSHAWMLVSWYLGKYRLVIEL